MLKRNRGKYLSGYEWALIIDTLNSQPGLMYRQLAHELASKGLADN